MFVVGRNRKVHFPTTAAVGACGAGVLLAHRLETLNHQRLVLVAFRMGGRSLQRPRDGYQKATLGIHWPS